MHHILWNQLYSKPTFVHSGMYFNSHTCRNSNTSLCHHFAITSPTRIQVTSHLSSLNTAHRCSQHGPATAWITSDWPEMFYLFQKCLFSWEHEYIFSRNKITSVKVTFCVSFYNLSLLKSVGTPLRAIA
jgi:hypothetical protein